MPFLLDTCALSEFISRKPQASVITRLRTLPREETFIPSVAIGEINQGIERLPPSKRRDELAAWLFNQVIPAYFDRIIPLDKDEALQWGALQAHLDSQGKPIEIEDSLIAAIALTHNLTLVTRNVDHFIHCKVRLYNPWD